MQRSSALAAGQGVADAIKAVMVASGMSAQQAVDAFYFVDSKGAALLGKFCVI